MFNNQEDTSISNKVSTIKKFVELIDKEIISIYQIQSTEKRMNQLKVQFDELKKEEKKNNLIIQHLFDDI